MVAALWEPQLGALGGQIADGGASSMGEVYEAARRETLTGHTLIARQAALEQSIDEKNDRIREATGVALDNPFRRASQFALDNVAASVPSAGMPEYWRGEALEAGQTRRLQYEREVADYGRRLTELRDQFPQHVALFGDVDEQEAARRQTQANERTLASVSARGPGGGATLLATLAGGFVGSMQDPLQFVANVLAPGAGSGRSLLYHAAKSAAINASVEAGIQPFVQAWRAEAGVAFGFKEAAQDIAMAGAAGAGLDVLFRGGLRTIRVLRGGNWIEVPATRANVEEALDDAAMRLPEGHPIREAAEGRPDKLAEEIERLGEAAPTELRALAQRAGDEGLFAAPEGADDVRHIEGLAQAIRNAVAPEAEPPGFAGVRSPELDAAVADGRVAEDLAALVARSTPTERQLELAETIIERGAATPAEARRLIAETLQRPRQLEATPETRLGSRGFEDVKGEGAKAQLEALVADVEPRVRADPEPAARQDGGAAAARDPAEVRRTLDAEIGRVVEEMRALLPRGVTVRSFADLADLPQVRGLAQRGDAVVDAASGARVEALQLDDVIYLATSAVAQRGLIAHEAVHVMRNLGLIAPEEMRLLAARAREGGAFPADVEARYRAAYEARYPDDVARRLDEEAAAHLIERRVNGDDLGRQLNGVADRVRQFLERLGNALRGLGFRTADDVAAALLGGEIAARAGASRFADATSEPMLAIRDAETGRDMRRAQDALGYYSKALEAARSLKQAKGTPEQMLAQLKAAGVKDSEIEATGLDKLLAAEVVLSQSPTGRILYRGARIGDDRGGPQIRFMSEDQEVAYWHTDKDRSLHRYEVLPGARIADFAAVIDRTTGKVRANAAPDLRKVLEDVARQRNESVEDLAGGLGAGVGEPQHIARQDAVLNALREIGYDLARLPDTHSGYGSPSVSTVALNSNGVRLHSVEGRDGQWRGPRRSITQSEIVSHLEVADADMAMARMLGRGATAGSDGEGGQVMFALGGSNDGPPLDPEITIDGKSARVPVELITQRFSTNADVNEALIRRGGDIDRVVAEFRRYLKDFDKSKAQGDRWYNAKDHAKIAESLDAALAYKDGVRRSDQGANEATEDWRGRWYHGTNVPFETIKASESGHLGPGVYLTRNVTEAKTYAGEKSPSRRVLEISARGALMPYNQYLRLASAVGKQLGLEEGSDVLQQALMPVIRQYGYGGVRLGQGRDAIAAVFDPADIKVTKSVMFALRDLADRSGATLIDDIGPNDPAPSRVLALHGTGAAADFDRFELPITTTRTNQFGVHFGTLEQAESFSRQGQRAHAGRNKIIPFQGGRVMPVVIYARNVVTTSDLTSWFPDAIAEELAASAKAEAQFPGLHESLKPVLKMIEDDTEMERLQEIGNALRAVLARHDIEAIRYRNQAEGEGWSYLIWDEGRVQSATSGDVMFALREPATPASAARADLEVADADLAMARMLGRGATAGSDGEGGQPMFALRSGGLRGAIEAAVAAKTVSREQADEVMAIYDRFERQHRLAYGDAEAARRAQADTAEKLEAEAAQRRRAALLQVKSAEVIEAEMFRHRNARGDVDPAQFLWMVLEHSGQTDDGARIPSVEGLRKAMLGAAQGRFEAALYEFRTSAFAGRRMNKARLENVARELFGKDTGDVAAKGFGRVWSEIAEDFRQRYNEMGGAIGKREDWGMPQRHDAIKMKAAGYEAWRRDQLAWLDPARMTDHLTGKPMTREDLDEALQHAWDNIMTEGWAHRDPSMQPKGRGALVRQHAESRFFVYKDADAWLAYQRKYGEGDIFATMMGHINLMSRDIAAMQVLGPNPEATREWMRQMVMKEAQEAARGAPGARFPLRGELLGRKLDPVDYASRMIHVADQMWAHMRGAAGTPVSTWAATVVGTMRNVVTGFALTGASLSAVATDPFIQKAARLYAGVEGRFGNVAYGFDLVGEIVNQMRGAPRREAVRAGLILDSAMNVMRDEARGLGFIGGPEWSRFFVDRVLTLNGLTGLTQAGRHSFGLSFMSTAADHQQARLADMPKAFARTMGRYGIDEGDWAMIGLARLHDLSADGSGATILRPAEIMAVTPGEVRDLLKRRHNQGLMGLDRVLTADELDVFMGRKPAPVPDPEARSAIPTDAPDVKVARYMRDLAERYHAMIIQETVRAVPEATVRGRAALIGDSQPGTFVGEALRSASMFKSFGVSMAMLHIGQLVREAAAGGKPGSAQFAVALAIGLPIGGAIAIQLKALRDGRDPDSLASPDFWLRAMAQGGGWGIYGDFVLADTNRMGGSWSSTVAGPLVGRAENIWNLTAGNLRQLSSDKNTNFGAELTRFVQQNTPFVNMPYTKLAWDRLFVDRMREMMDPRAHQAWRRMETEARKKGSGYWWGPGRSQPERWPSLQQVLTPPPAR